MMTRLVAGDRCVRNEDAGTELGKRFFEGLNEKFLRRSSSNLCDYVPMLRWIDYEGVKQSMVRQKRVDEGGDKKTLIGTLLCLQESEPDFYTDDLIKSLILVSDVFGSNRNINSHDGTGSVVSFKSSIDVPEGQSRELKGFFEGLKKSMVILQKKRDECLQGLIDEMC
ncbi:unnamed protein product [Camellia sinensis]